MQVNIDAFVVVHAIWNMVSRDFSIAPSTLVGSGRRRNAPPPASLHALKVQIRQQQTVLREGDDFTLKARLTRASTACKFCRFFRPETGSICSGCGQWWCLSTAINQSVFLPLLSVRLQFRQHFLLEFDHVWMVVPAGRLSERHGPS